jgi:uncharacterized damage-inducible protein DinB
MQPDRSTLTTFYRGWHEYQQRLSDALAPLTEEQLALHASPGQRPLWLLAAHVIGTRIGWFQTWMGEGGPELTPLDLWDADDALPRSAAELLEGLDLTWAMIADCLARWTPAMLDDEFTRERPHGTVTRSRQWIIWHVIEHDLHHGGEISLTLGNHGLAALDL